MRPGWSKRDGDWYVYGDGYGVMRLPDTATVRRDWYVVTPSGVYPRATGGHCYFPAVIPAMQACEQLARNNAASLLQPQIRAR